MSIDQQTAIEALVAECEAANRKTLSQFGVGVIDLNAIERAKVALASEPLTVGWPEYVAGVIVAYLGGGVEDERIKAIAGIIARRMWAIPKADAPVAEPVALTDGVCDVVAIKVREKLAAEKGIEFDDVTTDTDLHWTWRRALIRGGAEAAAALTRPPAPEEDAARKPLTEAQLDSLCAWNRAGVRGLARLVERAHGITDAAMAQGEKSNG